MVNNPYETPKTIVEDAPIYTPPRPPEILRACRILWILFVLGLFSLHPAIRGKWWVVHGENTPAALGIIVGAVMLTVLVPTNAALIWFVSRRHNWARWGLLTLLVSGWYGTATDLHRTISDTPIAAVFDSLSAVLELVACYFIFFGPGAKWFKSKKNSANKGQDA